MPSQHPPPRSYPWPTLERKKKPMTKCPICTNHADIYYRYMGNLICADCAAPLRMIGRELEKVET